MTGNNSPPGYASEKGGSSTGRRSTDDTTPSKRQSLDQASHLKRADTRLDQPGQADNVDDVFAHLPSDEAEVLKRQTFIPQVKTSFFLLYRYSTRNDLWIIFVSAICAIIGGAAFPLMTVVFGNLQGVFQDYFQGFLTYHEFTDKMSSYVLYFVYLAIGEFIVIYVSTVGFIYTGEHISAKIREHFLESCMKQNIGFFDKIGAGEVTTRITADTNLIQEGLSEKIGLTLTGVSTFVSAFVIGFARYWKLTCILLSTLFALLLVMGGSSRPMMKFNKEAIACYAEGGSLADEVIGSIRNAVAFGTQTRLAKQYDVSLAKAERSGLKAKMTTAGMLALMMMVLFLNYALAFWQGSKFIVSGEVELSRVITVMMAVMIGAFNLGQIAPHIQAFVTAIAASAKIYNTIDRPSPLDPTDDQGEIPDSAMGAIRLENVKHIYPSRPEVVVMKDVSLDIPAGKTTALVGASGSGKSTIIGLVERFYEPVGGQIYLDGRDITTLNLRWLRRQIALVSQEPTLFATTIFHNIAHGLIGTEFEDAAEEKRRELVVEAAKMANAHDFVSGLPDGYDTHVGERGFLLSGGQKQRIAIARAVVSNPKILLLDEATSALDTKSEGVVQAALENASQGRTTIAIAHRLSTIKDAHNIVVMAEGKIVEQGTHDELLAAKGAYADLVTTQTIAAANEMSAEEQEAIDEDEEKLMKHMSRQSTREKGYKLAPEDEEGRANFQRTNTQTSLSSMALRDRQGSEEQQYGLWTLIKLILSFNKPELAYMILGLVFSIICGGANPTSAVFFAKEITTLSVPITDANAHQVRHDSDFWSVMFVMLALTQLLGYGVQGWAFAKCSERLIRRVRDRSLRTILRQDVEFFDRDENTTGALTSFLSTETTHVAGLSGVTAGALLSVSTTLIAAIALSISIGWKLALVCTATIPVLLGCGFLRFHMLARFQQRSKNAYANSATFASEAISAIRTVASLGREKDVLAQYQNSLAQQQRDSLRAVLKSSLLYAASQSLMFLCFALGFWYGGTLIAKGEYTMFQFFVCFMAIVFGAQSAGTIFSFAPDMGKAHQAVASLKTLFDRKPTVDTWSNEGASVSSMRGSIEFQNVHFRYPTRPEQPVLRGLNLTVEPGQYVALVGPSGCGKSTTISLLERFYDPLAGGIFVDGQEISTLNVNEYRSHIALVSQEPTLYQGTIKDNILLGTSVTDVPDSLIDSVCREANIYDFIMSLPEGFNTMVGSKGALLSGGQKQRIAIARALVRSPKILLLDEATSALDSESEHVVQAALDKAAKGRTTVAVAHRLSSIQKADVIYVFDQGRIVEQGNHSELMKANGRYAELVNLQSLNKHA